MKKTIQMKMHRFKKEDLLGLAFNRMNVLVVSAFFFMVGVSSGIFLERMMLPATKESVIAHLLPYLETGTSDFSFPNPFGFSLVNNFVLLLILFVVGLSVYLFPSVLLVLFFKGLALGFSACLIIGALSLEGVFFILLSVIPQNILLIPAFIFAASNCINYALLRLSHKRKQSYPFRKNANKAISFHLYCVSFIVPAAMIFVGCIIEGLIFFMIF